MIRCGIGYDIHRLEPGRKLILGGVEIQFWAGLSGHSDADALVHAIIDALLGATGLGNIGTNFPDSDEKYKNITSLSLLEETNRMIKEKGFVINYIDTVIIAQQPKLAPFVNSMKENIAKILEISIDQISIKPKTNEYIDSVGRQEAIAAWAVATVFKDDASP